MSQIEQETEKLDAILEKLKIDHEALMKIFPTLDLQKIIGQRKREKKQLEEKIAQAQKEINKLKQNYQALLEKNKSLTKSVSLPDPKPAPYGSQPVTFLCRYGRIIPFDYEDLFYQK